MKEFKKEDIGNLLKNGYRIKSNLQNDSIRFPRDIKVSLSDKNIVVLELKTDEHSGILGNMQNNDSAFEAWCLILKYWIKDFNNSQFSLTWKGEYAANDPHYQRFLYRVKKFQELFSWFNLGEDQDKILEKDMRINPSKKILLNRPRDLRPRLKVDEYKKYNQLSEEQFNKLTEHEIERIFSSFELPMKNLAEKTGADEKTISYQLPIGIFEDKVSSGNELFPGKKGAIDLWAIGKDKQELYIFELKKIKGNAKPSVGAISELFFYAKVMADVQQRKFIFDDNKNNVQDISSILLSNKINAYLLVDKPHPLIADNIIGSNNWGGINFGCLKYDSKFNVDKIW